MKKIIILVCLLMFGKAALCAGLDTTTPIKNDVEKTITLTGELVFWLAWYFTSKKRRSYWLL